MPHTPEDAGANQTRASLNHRTAQNMQHEAIQAPVNTARRHRTQDEHATSTRTACTYASVCINCCQACAAICAFLPWVLVTLWCLFTPVEQLDGGFRPSYYDKIFQYGQHIRCNMSNALLRPQSMQIGKMIFSKNQCDTPAKTGVESMRIIFSFFCTNKRRFSAADADDYPTRKHAITAKYCEPRSPGTSVSVHRDPRVADAQTASDSPVTGLQGESAPGKQWVINAMTRCILLQIVLSSKQKPKFASVPCTTTPHIHVHFNHGTMKLICEVVSMPSILLRMMIELLKMINASLCLALRLISSRPIDPLSVAVTIAEPNVLSDKNPRNTDTTVTIADMSIHTS